MTFSHDHEYHRLLQYVWDNGEDSIDRTGVGTRSVFGAQMRFDLSKAFPAITTKQLAWKAVIGELLWFLEGSGDNCRLAQITHGDPTKKTIWTDNANADYWKPKAKFEGDLGRVYGVQWRSWKSVISDGSTVYIDQIANIINSLKNNPKDRRMILTAFNVGELDQMALPPCHMFAQFHVSLKTNKVNCQVYIRSNDLFLGAPFNIASYAALVHLLARECGREVGELIITIGDAHIYSNHFEQIQLQLERQPFASPKLIIAPGSLSELTPADFVLEHYNCHPAIKAPMAV